MQAEEGRMRPHSVIDLQDIRFWQENAGKGDVKRKPCLRVEFGNEILPCLDVNGKVNNCTSRLVPSAASKYLCSKTESFIGCKDPFKGN